MKKEILILLVIVGSFALIQSINFVTMPSTKSSPLLVQTDDKNFYANMEAAEDWVLLDFWAPWCAPCLKMKPAINDLAEENRDRISVLSVNHDEAPGLVNEFQIQGIPALVLMYKDREISRRIGLMPKTELTNWVRDEMQDSKPKTP